MHEGTIEQAYRLFADRLYNPAGTPVDEEGRIRIDDWEMREDVQAEVDKLWNEVTTDTVDELTDLIGYRKEFFQLFGFETDGVDYEADISTEVEVPNVR